MTDKNWQLFAPPRSKRRCHLTIHRSQTYLSAALLKAIYPAKGITVFLDQKNDAIAIAPDDDGRPIVRRSYINSRALTRVMPQGRYKYVETRDGKLIFVRAAGNTDSMAQL